jgi:hypothetical protein
MCSAESECPSWLFRLGVGVVGETCEEERKFRDCKQVLAGEVLPEWYRAGARNSLKREAHEARDWARKYTTGHSGDSN